MGKPQILSKKLKKLAKKRGLEKKDGTLSGGKYTIDQILDKAESFIEEYNYTLAQKFCQRALEMDGDNVRALETSASLLIEAGEVDKAKQCLGRAVTVEPDTGYEKFLSLAQLFNGQESLQLYQQGVKIIQNQIADQPSLKRDLSSAFCSIADLFMTDLCDDPNAEKQCDMAIKNSVETDDQNPEAWQTKARLDLIRNNFEDGRKNLKHSLSLWLPSYEAIRNNKTEEMGAQAQGFDPVEVSPLLYTTRISAVKMLIELEEWDQAVQILDGLLEEDDEVVETWYLLGWVNRLRATLPEETKFEKDSTVSKELVRLKPPEKEETGSVADGYNSNARYYLRQAKKVHTSSSPTTDDQMVNHIEELLQELGPGGDDDEDCDPGVGADNEEEWVTDEEEEMDQN